MTAEDAEFIKYFYHEPLRCGLLVWGCLKLTVTFLLLFFTALIINMNLHIFVAPGLGIIAGCFLLFLTIDIIMTIELLISAHQKSKDPTITLQVCSLIVLGMVAGCMVASTIISLFHTKQKDQAKSQAQGLPETTRKNNKK